MNAQISHVGRCMVSQGGKQCGKPAAYVQIWTASRVFRYCEEHVSGAVKNAAHAKEKVATESIPTTAKEEASNQ